MGLVCALFHRKHHCVVAREGDYTHSVCVECFRCAIYFRPFEPGYIRDATPEDKVRIADAVRGMV